MPSEQEQTLRCPSLTHRKKRCAKHGCGELHLELIYFSVVAAAAKDTKKCSCFSSSLDGLLKMRRQCQPVVGGSSPPRKKSSSSHCTLHCLPACMTKSIAFGSSATAKHTSAAPPRTQNVLRGTRVIDDESRIHWKGKAEFANISSILIFYLPYCSFLCYIFVDLSVISFHLCKRD